MLPPRRFLPQPRSSRIRSVSPWSVRSCGVSVRLASGLGAKAVMISDSGETTALFSPLSCQVVRIDMESLPTGMLMPSAGHNSLPTACTASNKAASSPGWPAAAIQLAERRISPISLTAAAARLVIDSPTAIRPEAAGLIRAIGLRSPSAKASPSKES